MAEVDLSIVIPFAVEWPAIAFTLRSVCENITVPTFEVIAIDNWANEISDQIITIEYELEERREDGNPIMLVEKVRRKPDRGHDHFDREDVEQKSHIGVMAAKRAREWLKYVPYHDKLSHWQAKNAGVAASRGRALLFLDAHVVPSRGAIDALWRGLNEITAQHGPLVTAHLPTTYHILESKANAYALIDKRASGEVHYTLSGVPDDLGTKYPWIEIPCMSTCGMMLWRECYDFYGGWPKELGIYGGGENFWNFAGSVMGVKKFLVEGGKIHHLGDKRGYNWNFSDYLRNRMIATYCFGGEEWLARYTLHAKGRDDIKEQLKQEILVKCALDRARVERQAKTTIEEWLDEWRTRLSPK